jgi:hypothetical protein
MVLVKGVSRRVIVVDSPDPQIFEQAIFVLSSDGAGVNQQQLVDQAVRVAKSYARTHGIPQRSLHMTPPLWMAAGSAVIGAIWAAVALL